VVALQIPRANAGFYVKVDAMKGYAKPSKKAADGHPRAAHEKIASDLGFHLDLPIPPAVLWRRSAPDPRDEGCCVVSLVCFEPSHPWRHAQTTTFASQIVDALGAPASAMMVFDTWLDNHDRINEGNLLVSGVSGAGEVSYAYIDFAYALSYGWRGGRAMPINNRRGPYPGNITPDIATISATIQAIEELDDARIRDTVERVPGDFLAVDRRECILDGLRSRKNGLRDAFRLMLGA